MIDLGTEEVRKDLVAFGLVRAWSEVQGCNADRTDWLVHHNMVKEEAGFCHTREIDVEVEHFD